MRPYIFIAGMLAALHAQAGTLSDVLEKAWQRTPAAQAQVSREAELKANRSAADSLFPGSPSVGMGYRTDQANRNFGRREIELDVTVPLWLPGEKSARQSLAGSESERYTAEQRAQRLQLAGEIREAVWQVRLADNAHKLARKRLDTARLTESDVARRVKAGEMARTDLLLAQTETIAAQAALGDAERELAAARLVFIRLVGSDDVQANADEEVKFAPDLDRHPLLAAKRHRVAVAQARATVVARTGRDNPELSVGARRERADYSDRYGNTIAVAVRIPFGTEARNAPRIASAQADLDEAEAEYRRLRVELEQSIRKARADVDAARQKAALADSRKALAAEHLQLIRKAFSLGERSLVEYQRTQALANESQLAASQAGIELQRAIARLNQAQGVLP